MKTTKILTLLIFAFMLSTTAQAQDQAKEAKEAKPVTTAEAMPVTKEASYRIEGNKIVKVKKASKQKQKPTETKYTFTIKGKEFRVYKGSKGGLFVYRTSKKTGKRYKQYLKL